MALVSLATAAVAAPFAPATALQAVVVVVVATLFLAIVGWHYARFGRRHGVRPRGREPGWPVPGTDAPLEGAAPGTAMRPADAPAWMLYLHLPNAGRKRLRLDRTKLAEGGEIIGRDLSRCTIRLDNPRVSRRHARLFWAEGALWIEDLGSRNGTFARDGSLLAPHQPRRLAESDELHIADLILTLRPERADPRSTGFRCAPADPTPSEGRPRFER